MDNRDNVAEKFRDALGSRLKGRFGKSISAQRFADQYNLHAHGTTPISRETARRWIRGDAIPDYGHLLALVRWLGMNPDEFLGGRCHAVVGKGAVSPTSVCQSPPPQAVNLLKLLEQLDDESVGTIVAIAEALALKSSTAKLSGIAS